MTALALCVASVLVYVVLDARDLGAGILYPLVARQTDARTLFRSAAPFWDANEVWLLVSAIALIAAFPAAVSAFAPQVYVPSLIIVACFVVRAAAFHFQDRDSVLRRLLQWIFAGASILSALGQGWIVGCLLEALGPADATSGSLWSVRRELLPLAGAVGAVGIYALVGCCWLIVRTSGPLQILGREVALSALIPAGVSLIAVCALMVTARPHVALPWPGTPLVSGLLLASAFACGVMIHKRVWSDRDSAPLSWAILFVATACAAVFACAYPLASSTYDAGAAAATRSSAWIAIAILVLLATLQLVLALRAVLGKIPPAKEQEIASRRHIGARRTNGQQPDLHLS